ncbi:MAG: 8-oxoguanine DNA glycosylase [Chthoniobacterales bacterium]|nr:8-oxoguanine DNA glycosylase [Chthoniobacterales bacterium]
MKLTMIAAPEFDLTKTLDSGQVFHWEPLDAGYAGIIGERAVYVQQRGDSLLITPGMEAAVRRYFALDHPLREICGAFPTDSAMCAARDFCRGLRIIRQPEWECLASFITSSMKQVAHIRQMSRALRARFGEVRKLKGVQLFAFPIARRLADATEQELRMCALGYRARNLLATARRVASGEADMRSWRTLPDAELRARLCELPGVGAKVANCVMLFAYERLRAFPIDVWIERVLKEKYFPRARKLTAERLRRFCEEYFGEHGGYAQQYLFHHARKTTPRRRLTVKRPSRRKLSGGAARDTIRRAAVK